MRLRNFLFIYFILLGLLSCSDDDKYENSGDDIITPEPGASRGLYILSEGGWGRNEASLTYYDYDSGNYTNDYFGWVNPNEGVLGDVGNDINIYGSKMYAVINNSNYVEVMEAKTAKHLGKIQIPNCRSVTFDKGYAYVSSFAGTPQSNNSQLGTIVKIDTTNLSIVNNVSVGYQPEEMTVVNDKLYVANSGGYTPESYDTTVSVIDLSSFQEVKKIDVGANLWKIKADKNNNIWVTSRGNYNDIKPFISIIDPNTDTVIKTITATITGFDFYENNLYYYGTDYDSANKTVNSYGIIDINTQNKISSHIMNENTESQIVVPYGIIINPDNGDIFIADARDYQISGKIFCINKNGILKWVRNAGVSPGHFTFLTKK
ncbi:MAG: YncE family protein [Flavobacteriaceae bacterium]|jgi:hypothetical protein|nr:YncE family protein [Flavobacteriaceae bacterium]